MECPHPQLRGHSRADHLLDALPHLFGGLVGKCKSQYTPWLIAMVQQMYNLICEHTCLARPGAGDYQLRAIIVDYGVALLVIQLQKIVIFFGHITSRLPASRWRTTSYMMTPAATDTLSEPICPNCGMLTNVSHCFSTSGDMPTSSAPITMATGPV